MSAAPASLLPGRTWMTWVCVALAVCALAVVGAGRLRTDPVRLRLAQRAITSALQDRGVALLRGDRPGWLASVDRALWPELELLYGNLRGFEVSAWLPSVTLTEEQTPFWYAEIRVRVCFAGAECPRDARTYAPAADVVTARTQWRVSGDSATLVSFRQSAPITPAAAVPWRTAALTFTTGSRVIIAARPGTTPPLTWLSAADRAARTADRFCLSPSRPGKYLLFLAATADWTATIGAATEATAFVDRTSEQTAFVVLDAAEPPDELLLRHELGHVATLLGTLGTRPEWAIEGLAEYVAYEQRPVTSYRLLGPARDLAARTHWAGRLDLDWSTDRTDRAGLYGMAYLSVRCLAETYGEPRTLAFFTAVARTRRRPEEASPATLAVPWPTAQSTCEPRIRTWLS